jgi:sugar/nucleoside kinase (ribokinase family)
MTSVAKPKVFGTGLIALDLVLGLDPMSPVRSWAGGTCGNVLSILAYLGWDAFPIARMNDDPASERVRADMAHWGVRLDFASCGPRAHTPIIIQEIRRGRDGKPKHRFSWSCPKCGEWLPSFKAVTTAAVHAVTPALDNASVFFLDRLSRAALTLAKEAAERGAVIVFEPPGKGTDKLMTDAIKLAHIVKYADQRLARLGSVMDKVAAAIVEVQTLGEQGLKYRHRFGRSWSRWIHVSAVPAPRLADACGSGDWCTAGLLAKVARNGLAGLCDGGADGLSVALRYGQALAAWNCGFEGARGGMYAVGRDAFDAQIAALLAGKLDHPADAVDEPKTGSLVDCPACSPSSSKLRVASHRVRRAAA